MNNKDKLTGFKKTFSKIDSSVGSIIIALFILLILFSVLSWERFWRIENLITILANASNIGILTCGMAMAIIMGGLDLSIACNAAFAPVLLAVCLKHGFHPIAALLIGIVSSCIFGLFNGLLITKGRLNPMIATVSTSLVIRALCYILTNAVSMPMDSSELFFLGRVMIGGKVPIYIVYFLLSCVVIGYILRSTRFGRHIYAIGGNEQAAYLSGINIDKDKIIVYIICGFLGSLAGITNGVANRNAVPQSFVSREFEVIAAVVLGGISLSGGRGTMIGAFLGNLVMTIIGNGLVLNGVQSYWMSFAQGIILILAVLIDAQRNKKTI